MRVILDFGGRLLARLESSSSSLSEEEEEEKAMVGAREMGPGTAGLVGGWYFD